MVRVLDVRMTCLASQKCSRSRDGVGRADEPSVVVEPIATSDVEDPMQIRPGSPALHDARTGANPDRSKRPQRLPPDDPAEQD
jgi:hypothetical protein